MTEGCAAELRRQMAAASQAEDFSQAAYLQQLLKVLGPAERPITLADAAPETPEAQAEFFLEHGFCVCPRVLQGERLERIQRAFHESAAEPARERWLAACASGERAPTNGQMDMEKLYNWDMLSEADDDCFYDILDPPALLGCLTRCLGGHVHCNGGKGRVIPSEPENEITSAEHADGYLSWHRDTGTFLGSGFSGTRWPRERRIKVLTAIFDSPGAGTALVPGSQLLPSPPERTLARSFLGGHGHYHKMDSFHPRFGPEGRQNREWTGVHGVDLPSSASAPCPPLA